METKEFEKLKAVLVPKLGISGLVGLNKGPDITIYSTERDSHGNNLLIINVILCGSSLDMAYETTGKAKERLLNEILNYNFQAGSFRVIRDGETILKEPLTDIEAGWHLCSIRHQINRKYKKDNKSMKTKEIFIPYYLEYVGTYSINWLLGIEGLLFKKVNGSYVLVYNMGKSRAIRFREFENDRELTKVANNDSLVRSVGKVIMSGDFSELEFKLFDGLGNEPQSIGESEKDQYLVTVLNCLDMNFSHKSIITDEVLVDWKSLREIDKVRSNELNEPGLLNPIAVDEGIFSVNRISIYGDSGLSDKIYEHFKNYKMKDKINTEKIGCVRDIEDRINFVKLDVKEQSYGGDFDLVGLKEKGDEEYSLVIREVSKSDLTTCKYRSLMMDEKRDLLTKLIDQDTNITSVMIQGDDGKIWQNNETNDVDGYRDYIEDVINKINDEDEEDGEDENEFIIDSISNKMCKIKERIEGDCRKYINLDSYSPIISSLSSISTYLSFLESRE
jgi:hypothetical protein